jgi:hypothetical protein
VGGSVTRNANGRIYEGGGIGGSVTRHAAVRSCTARPITVIDLPNALFALPRDPDKRWPGRERGRPPIGSRHRYTSREVLLGPVEEACDRGLERLDIMTLVFL